MIMGHLATNNRQLIYIYSEDSTLGQRILPYVKCLKKPVRIININNESIADTIWLEVAAMLDKPLSNLFSRSLKNLNSSDYDVIDWLKIINKKPWVLEKPIAINGTKAKQLKERYQIFSFFRPSRINFNDLPENSRYSNRGIFSPS